MATTMVTGALAASAAIGILIKSTTQFARELKIASTRNQETVENMQSWAFAAQTVGVSLEKLGDIGKDTNEKIGEFLATGGGGFVDFIDVMKLTTAEGVRLAETFSTMSGTDVLQEMVRQMEAAGVSSNKMSFALEGLASDTTDLIPLLTNSGEQLKVLRDNFTDVVNVLSAQDIEDIGRVAGSFDLLQSSFNAGSRQMIADYSEQIIAAINVIMILGTTSSNAFDVIASGMGNILAVSQALFTDLINGTDTAAGVIDERAKISREALDRLFGDFPKALEITIKKGNKALKDSVKEDKLSYDQKLDVFSKYLKASSIIQDAFFEDNKAIKAAIIVADTAVGITRQFADLPFYAALASSAVIAASGIAQLANLNSASKGGGNISTIGGGSTSAPPQENFQPETVTQELSVNTLGNDASTGLGDFTFNAEGGSDADEFMAMSFNDALRSGRITTGRQV